MKRTRLQRAADLWAELPNPARLMTVIAVVIVLAMCAGCATTQPVVQPRVAIPVACQEAMPERPVMPTEQLKPDATVDAYVQAAEAEIGRREGYEDQLRTALEACRKPVTP